MSATNEFKITQIVDNGQIIQLTLIENVSTEPISQKQMIIENVSKKLSYQQTQITISMPKSRYDGMSRPQVGNTINVNLKKI